MRLASFVAVCCLLMPASIWSKDFSFIDDFEAPTKEFYVGMIYSVNELNSKLFDGQSAYIPPSKSTSTASTQSILSPDISDGSGFGGMVGIKKMVKRKYAISFDISYFRSIHDSEWFGTKRDAFLENLGFNLKFYFRADRRLQPFIGGGFSSSKLTVEGGVLDSGFVVGDGEFHGAGGTAGLGFLFYLNNYLAIHGMGYYDGVRFGSVRDYETGDSVGLSPSVKTRNVNYEIGLSFRIGKR